MLLQHAIWPLSFVAHCCEYWTNWEKWAELDTIFGVKKPEKKTMSFIHDLTAEKLTTMEPNQLIQLTLALKEENERLITLANDETTSKRYDERLERLERELNLQKQYERRSSIEISGIPESIDDNKIEDTVINVLKAAGSKVHNRDATYFDTQAAHRKGKKGVVIYKFVNRKFAYTYNLV